MYGKNIANFLGLIVTKGALTIDPEDQVVAESMVCRDGKVVQPRVAEMLGQTPAPVAEPEPAESESEPSEEAVA